MLFTSSFQAGELREVPPMAVMDKQFVEADRQQVGRERLLKHGLSSVRHIAGTIHRKLPRHVPYEDLFNSGVVGLMDALRKFDPEARIPFACYAKHRIRGAIFDSLREMDNGSRGLRRKSRQIEEMRCKLRSTRQSEPSDIDVANEIGISLQQLRDVECQIEALKSPSVSSRTDKDENKAVIESIPSPEKDNPLNILLRSEVKELLMAAINELVGTEKKVVLLYYFHEFTMKQVGAVLSVGESRVSQIHLRAIEHLRSFLLEMGDQATPVAAPEQGSVNQTVL